MDVYLTRRALLGTFAAVIAEAENGVTLTARRP